MAVITSVLPKLYLYTDDWQDISEHVQSFRVQWGRTNAWANIRPRTLTVKLNNPDRLFEPGSGSTYNTYWKQGALLYADLYYTYGEDSSAVISMFYGTVGSIKVHYQGHRKTVSYVTVEAADPMAILAKEETDAEMAGDTADVMVADVLDHLTWTGGTIDYTALTAGTAVLQTAGSYNATLLSLINKIAFSDQRIFWLQPDVDKKAVAFLEPMTGLTFAADGRLTDDEIFDMTISVDDDQCCSHVRMSGADNDIGDPTYDEAGGTVDDQWTLAGHGLTDLQDVWFSAVGTGATGYAVNTHYWVIDCSSADYFQLASSYANAVANTQIQGTGDSVGTWTLRVCGSDGTVDGADQTASQNADALWMGERWLSETGLLLATNAEVLARAQAEAALRHALLGELRPMSVTVKVSVGETWASTALQGKAQLMFPMRGLETTFDTGVIAGPPSVRSSSAGEGVGVGGGSSNVSVVLPANVAAGDLLVVFIAQDGMNLLEDGDSGFTYLTGAAHASNQVAAGIFYKTAEGDEGGATVGFHGTASLDFAYTAYAFKDAAVTAPAYSASPSTGTDDSVEPPECDAGTSAARYWMSFAGCDRDDFDDYPDDLTLNRRKAGTADLFNASAASAGIQSTTDAYTPSGVFDMSGSDEWLCWTIGIAGGTTRSFQVYTLGGSVSGKAGEPITIQAFTDAALVFE